MRVSEIQKRLEKIGKNLTKQQKQDLLETYKRGFNMFYSLLETSPTFRKLQAIKLTVALVDEWAAHGGKLPIKALDSQYWLDRVKESYPAHAKLATYLEQLTKTE